MSETVSLKQLTDELDRLEEKAVKDISKSVDEKSIEELRVAIQLIKNEYEEVLSHEVT